MDYNWRKIVPNTVKCKDFVNFNAYSSAKAKQKVTCPYCNEIKSYSSMDCHVMLKHANENDSKEYREDMYEKNKEYINKHMDDVLIYREKVSILKKAEYVCECGCTIVKGSLNSHLKTKKHNDKMKELNKE